MTRRPSGGAASAPDLEEVGEQLGVVLDGLVQAVVGVLVAQRVERMRIGGEDLLEVGLAERLHVLLDQQLEEAFLADPADVVAGVALGLVQQAEVHLGLVSGSGPGPGRMPAADRRRRRSRRRTTGTGPTACGRRGCRSPVPWSTGSVGGPTCRTSSPAGPGSAGRPAAPAPCRPSRRGSCASRRWSAPVRCRPGRPRHRPCRSCRPTASRRGSRHRRRAASGPASGPVALGRSS